MALATAVSADQKSDLPRLPADRATPAESSEAARAQKWTRTSRTAAARQTSQSRVIEQASAKPAEQLFMPVEAAQASAETGGQGNTAGAYQRPSAPQMAAEAREQIATEKDRRYSRAEKTAPGFSARMSYVLSGGMVSSSAESVGEWWEERSGQMLQGSNSSSKGPRQPAMQQLANATEKAVDSMTLPEQMDPEVDFYEAGPIAVSAPILQTSGMDEAVDESAPASRLKTDIRSIKPTLSYALKNIDKEQLPEDFDSQLEAGEYAARQSSPIVYQWAPTNFYHYPLYFQDPSLERYGHTYHPVVQPFASTGLFATQLVGLPYQMVLNPVHSKQYSLGYYRPGECAPKKHYQIPFNEEATAVEVATIVGLFLIIP